MEDRSHALLAIAFLVALGGGAAALVLWIQAGSEEEKVYEVMSPYSVSGLSPQSPVQYKGVRVGTVRKVELGRAGDTGVRIRFTVIAKTPVTRSTYAQVSTRGLTGMSYLSLNDSGEAAEPLESSEEQPARIPMRRGWMQRLQHRAQALLEDADTVAKRLAKVLDEENRERVAATLERIDEAAARLVAMEEAAMPAVERLPEITAEAERALTQSRRMVQRVSSETRSLARSANGMAQQVSAETLPRLDALIRSASRTVEQIDALARELEQSPQSILFGAPPPEAGPGEPGFGTAAAEGR